MRIFFAGLFDGRVAARSLIPALLFAAVFLLPFVDCLLSLFLGYSGELNYLCTDVLDRENLDLVK